MVTAGLAALVATAPVAAASVEKTGGSSTTFDADLIDVEITGADVLEDGMM